MTHEIDITPKETNDKETLEKKAQALILKMQSDLENQKMHTTMTMLKALDEELKVTHLRNQVNSALLESFLKDLELEAKSLTDPNGDDSFRIPVEAKIFMYKNTSKASSDQLGHIVNAFKSEGGSGVDKLSNVPTANNPLFDKRKESELSKEDIDKAKLLNKYSDKIDQWLELLKKQETPGD